MILKGFSRRVCLVIPLTTSAKRNIYHLPVGNVNGKRAAIIISQIRLIDTRRLDQHIDVMNKNTFDDVRKAVKGMF